MINNKNFSGKKPRYTLNHPEKYLGDPNNVVYRSTWELNAFKFCDNNKHVLLWASEEIKIPYMKPVFNNLGRLTTKAAIYYPDLYVEYVNKSGELIKELIEIKPKKQTRASRARTYTTNLFENMAYMVNTAKWDAAKAWCKPRQVNFRLITEDSLFRKHK